MKEIFSFIISAWYAWGLAIIAASMKYLSLGVKGYFGEKSVSFFFLT